MCWVNKSDKNYPARLVNVDNIIFVGSLWSAVEQNIK